MNALPTVVLYKTPACHLCEEVEVLLERLQARYPHQLRAVDITSDPALFARYRYAVPVLAVGGREYAAPLAQAVVERALAGAR